MILPTKQLRLENSLLYYSCQIIRELSQQNRTPFELYTTLKNTHSNLLYSDFMLALDILKALQKIQYQNKYLEFIK